MEIPEVSPELQVNVDHNEFANGLGHLLVVEWNMKKRSWVERSEPI